MAQLKVPDSTFKKALAASAELRSDLDRVADKLLLRKGANQRVVNELATERDRAESALCDAQHDLSAEKNARRKAEQAVKTLEQALLSTAKRLREAEDTLFDEISLRKMADTARKVAEENLRAEQDRIAERERSHLAELNSTRNAMAAEKAARRTAQQAQIGAEDALRTHREKFSQLERRLRAQEEALRVRRARLVSELDRLKRDFQGDPESDGVGSDTDEGSLHLESDSNSENTLSGSRGLEEETKSVGRDAEEKDSQSERDSHFRKFLGQKRSAGASDAESLSKISKRARLASPRQSAAAAVTTQIGSNSDRRSKAPRWGDPILAHGVKY
ncbi:hypothetical protein GGX14DRAFT_454472 [Mycena pura]|uniref:Uncharacterized protein n=1 Tax=Mycena pura TaxID=153505 RepID=A0AAD6VCX2_9AGAR|nr:hypothetical protein GGX14DRAFT_454472 [Mycena pura]